MEVICTDDSSTHIIVVVDLNHWSIHTGTQAFHFYYSEHLVWSSLPNFDTCGEPNGETLHIQLVSSDTLQIVLLKQQIFLTRALKPDVPQLLATYVS